MKSTSFSSKQKCCWAAVFLMTSVPVVVYYVRVHQWLHEPGLSPLELTARQLAGYDSIDCGAVLTSDGNPDQGQTVAACEVKAFEDGKAFRGRIRMITMCCVLDTYVVGTPGGKVYRVFTNKDDVAPQNNVTNAVEEYEHPSVVKDPWPRIIEQTGGSRY